MFDKTKRDIFMNQISYNGKMQVIHNDKVVNDEVVNDEVVNDEVVNNEVIQNLVVEEQTENKDIVKNKDMVPTKQTMINSQFKGNCIDKDRKLS